MGSYKKIIIGLFLTSIIASFSWLKYHQLKLKDFAEVHSPIVLSEQQKKEVIHSDRGSVLAFRYLDKTKVWQVGTGDFHDRVDAPVLIGQLFKEALKPEVTVPVYLCAYQGFSGKNLSWDLNSNCSGEGKLVNPKPVGYVSEQIRTGFRMLARCKSPKSGMYLTFNMRCENPEDRLHGGLGSIAMVE